MGRNPKWIEVVLNKIRGESANECSASEDVVKFF